MTGEVTLTGQVLPIGGVREKVLAAQRAGLKRVILPRENESDLEELPEDAREAMEFVLADELPEVLAAALDGKALARAAPRAGHRAPRRARALGVSPERARQLVAGFDVRVVVVHDDAARELVLATAAQQEDDAVLHVQPVSAVVDEVAAAPGGRRAWSSRSATTSALGPEPLREAGGDVVELRRPPRPRAPGETASRA